MGDHKRPPGWVLGIGLVLLLGLALPANASADRILCAPSTATAFCDEPTGVASASATGLTYVADTANNRIDVFDSSGLLYAFGWGVADGAAEPQTCVSTCFEGIPGGGAGQFARPRFIAVDQSGSHDIFVFEQYRVQRFTAQGEFIGAWGGGVITGGASGTGTIVTGSRTVTDVVTLKKEFAVGQVIGGTGIAAETRIAAVGPGTITLSKDAVASATGGSLSVAEGAGNIPVNEVQVLPSLDSLNRGIAFTTPNPSPSVATLERPFPVVDAAPASGAGSIQEMLEGLPNIGPGDVGVTGPDGGPYTIEFKGRYEDTNVSSLQDLESGGAPLDSSAVEVIRNGGGSAEICSDDNDCAAGVKGAGPGQFGSQNQPVTAAANGDLYVADTLNTGFSGTTALFESQIKVFKPTGAFLKGISLPGSQSVDALAVDSGNRFYVTRGGKQGVELYDSVGALKASFSFDNTSALAIDPTSDHLVASHREGKFVVVTEVDEAGSLVRRIGYNVWQQAPASIAIVHSSDGDVFTAEPSLDRVRYLAFPPDGALPCCLDIHAGNTKAILKGQVNPEGKAATYHFEYITDADYLANGSSFTGPNPATKTPESAPVGPDFVLHPAEAQIGCTMPTDPPQPECLEPETDYRVRLVAKNVDGENSSEATFLSKDPFEIKATWSTDVGLDGAELHGRINPLGIPATAFFEYLDDASFKANGETFVGAVKAPAAPIDIGGGEAFTVASTPIDGLQPNTLYHYRVVVSNSFVEEGVGPETTFITFPVRPAILPCANDVFRVGFSAPLANCRAYEMVSPIDKNGGDIKVLVQTLSFPARLDQSADAGDAFTYTSVAAFSEPQSSLWANQYLARRGGDGWQSEAINQPKEPTNIAINPVLKLDAQYRLFNSDLSGGWVSQYANPQLDDCAPPGVINLYRRDNNSGDYEAIVPNPPTNIATNPDYRIELQGVANDESRAVFRANAKLTSNAAGGIDVYQVYLYIRDPEGGCGQLRLVSLKPSGAPVTQSSSAGSPAGPAEYRASTVARALSADGRRVFFTTEANPIATGPLFVRVNADQPQSPVAGGKCTAPELGCTLEITSSTTQFWSADTAGKRVIYSVGSELFEYDVDKALAGEPAKTLIAGGAQGVVGASEDASRIYFVSTQQIEGEGVAAKPNLYLYEPGKAVPDKYRLVATLIDHDLAGSDLYGMAVAQRRPIANGIRLSADGSHLAFVSQASLTGYDNLDADTEEPAIELYLYDTASEEVRCVSCNPSGSRPEAREIGVRQVAAMMAPGESQTFAPRSLSADGSRLFFESFESLLPRDENEAEDVYEWQRAADANECAAKGAELYVPASGGCLSLISSGEPGATDSELADASPDGSDVFIRTASSLVPQDPGQVDIYDVREGGGFPALVRQQPCEGEGCPGAVPPTPGTPSIASEAQGAGNPPAPAPCPKGKVRKAGKCKPKPCPKGKVRKGNKCKPKQGKGSKQRAAKNKKGGRK